MTKKLPMKGSPIKRASGRGSYRNDLLHAKSLLLDDLRISSCLLRPVTQTRDERSYVSTSSLLFSLCSGLRPQGSFDMTDFVELSRRKPKKRPGARYRDPATLSVNERLDRLLKTLDTRRSQLREWPLYEATWLSEDQIRSPPRVCA
jgi:hypothetical protein